MRVRILGSAAGGGLPQWNCACRNCRLAREGRIPARSQSGVAVSADGERWFLLNASPDLRAQVESFAPLQPPPGSVRGSPIEAVLVTNADLDHTLGLFTLREGGEVKVHATAAVRRSLTEGLRLDEVLRTFGGVGWTVPPSELAPLRGADGTASGLSCAAIPLSARPPRFVRSRRSQAQDPSFRAERSGVEEPLTFAGSGGAEPHAHDCSAPPLPTEIRGSSTPLRSARNDDAGTSEKGNAVAYEFADDRTCARLVFAPDVPEMTAPLAAALERADAILFDGTFWSESELTDLGASNRSAREMGHLPVSESLAVLARLNARRRIFLHINNTNPMLNPTSPEHAAVLAAGIEVAQDGMEFEL